MSKSNNLKRQKIRNNEYYDFQKVQDDLYSLSKKGKIFKNLMEYIISDKNILLAYRNIKKNKGSMTKGVDGKNIENIAKLEPEILVKVIRDKFRNYQPQKVRRVEIPKPNGKLRPLGIPTITDRMIQQCILQILEPICEAKFYKHSYGFRPLRGTSHAISRAYHLAQQNNLHYVVDVDIKGFFDNINHGKLIKQLWTLGIRDKALIAIISKMLKAEIENIGKPSKGTPQGGILSPLLANVALNELDHWISSQWENIPTKKQYALTRGYESAKIGSLKRTTKLKEIYIVRYADDFKLFCRNHQDAVKIFEATKSWLKNRLYLETSEEKSKIVNLKKNYSEFLGIKFKVHKKGKTGKENIDKWVIKSHICDKAIENTKVKIKEHIKNMQSPENNLIKRAVGLYNSFVLGTHNYFNCATHCNIDMQKLSNQIRHRIKHRLRARKRKKSDEIPKYINKIYGKSREMRFVKGHPIIPIGYVQHKQVSNFSKLSPFIPEDRGKIHDNQKVADGRIIRYMIENPILGQSSEYNDNRISLFMGQVGKCYVTKTELEVENMECHHVKPKSKGGNDKYNNLVLVTSVVHKLIHATKKDTIVKYLSEILTSKESIDKLNKLRLSVGNTEICV